MKKKGYFAVSKVNSQNQSQKNQSQANRLIQTSIVDDDLGFDPFIETQKGLAELMENEVVQQQNLSVGNSNISTQQQPQQVTHHHYIDNIHRARMPPPGFNHMSASVIGFNGSPRAHTSKIMPFVNMAATAIASNGTQVGQQIQMPLVSNWNPHLTSVHQNPGQGMSDNQLQHQVAHNKAGFNNNNNDWTSMDPAILSFRQFSSYPQPGQVPSHSQNQQDIFLQHLAQQQQQQNIQGFSNQPQQLIPGMTMLNGQQTSPQGVNANVQGMLEFLKNRQFV